MVKLKLLEDFVYTYLSHIDMSKQSNSRNSFFICQSLYWIFPHLFKNISNRSSQIYYGWFDQSRIFEISQRWRYHYIKSITIVLSNKNLFNTYQHQKDKILRDIRDTEYTVSKNKTWLITEIYMKYLAT